MSLNFYGGGSGGGLGGLGGGVRNVQATAPAVYSQPVSGDLGIQSGGVASQGIGSTRFQDTQAPPELAPGEVAQEEFNPITYLFGDDFDYNRLYWKPETDYSVGPGGGMYKNGLNPERRHFEMVSGRAVTKADRESVKSGAVDPFLPGYVDSPAARQYIMDYKAAWDDGTQEAFRKANGGKQGFDYSQQEGAEGLGRESDTTFGETNAAQSDEPEAAVGKKNIKEADLRRAQTPSWERNYWGYSNGGVVMGYEQGGVAEQGPSPEDQELIQLAIAALDQQSDMDDEDRAIILTEFENKFGDGSVEELIQEVQVAEQAGQAQQAPQGFAFGGGVQGSSDTTPAMLTPGEYVLPTAVVDNVGVQNLNNIVQNTTGQIPGGRPVQPQGLGGRV
jgi:hypothetical protein